MSDLTIELDKLIQQAALDGALTQKAVDMFHTVLKENEELRESLEKKDLFESLDQTVQRLQEHLMGAQPVLNKSEGLEKADRPPPSGEVHFSRFLSRCLCTYRTLCAC